MVSMNACKSLKVMNFSLLTFCWARLESMCNRDFSVQFQVHFKAARISVFCWRGGGDGDNIQAMTHHSKEF
jgi:hypothetical protein